MQSLFVSLIGGGYWGKNLIRELNNINVLSTVCEINKNLIEQYKLIYPNLKFTSEWKDILNSKEITAVCIALPAELHFKYAKEALLANKDVFVEKPITLKTIEARELIELAKNKNKILMVGHLLHYHSAIIKIKEIINSGKIGKIKNIISNRFNLGIFRTCENVLWSFAPHDISVILSLCGNRLPQWITCTGNDTIVKGIHDITNSVLYFGDGTYVNINVNWLNAFKEQKMTIICEKAMIVFDDTEKDSKLKIYNNYLGWSNGITPQPIALKSEPEIISLDLSESPLLRECKYFVECCKNRSQPITNGEEGLLVLEVLDYLTTSLTENKKIYLSSSVEKNFYAHETAIIDEGCDIGEGTKIWHYSHICKGAKIGKNCNIGQNCFIAGGAVLGDNCKVQNNVSIYAGVEAGNYVFFGPSCVLTNDLNPRAKYSKNGEYLKTILEDGVTLGANCTIVCGKKIGKDSLIGAGAVVTKNVEPGSIMIGNPAKKLGTIDEYGNMQHLNNN